jgi:DNA-binding MurR/RpiR family transcriptional regulator
MTPLDLLRSHYDSFTKAEQKVADFILNDPHRLVAFNLANLAQQSGTSNAAVIRMCQKMGFDGFSEFKFSFNRWLLSLGADSSAQEAALQDAVPKNDHMQNLLDTYFQYIRQIPTFVSEAELKELAGHILAANRLDIWGINRTAQSAAQLSHRLLRLGIYNRMVSDTIVMSDASDTLGRGDVVILFTLNGRGSITYADLLAVLKKRGCYTVLVTMNPKLKAAQHAQQVVTLPWVSHANNVNFYEDQIIVYFFIELLLYEVARLSPLGDKERKELVELQNR